MDKFIKIIIGLLSFLIIILLPVFLIIWQYNLFFPKTQNIDHLKYQEEVMGYLLNKSELPVEMTDLEVLHMEDVRILINYSRLILLFSIVIVLLLYFFLKYQKKTLLFYKALRISTIFIFSITITFVVLSFFDFSSFFNIFHEVFFPQGNWLFPVSSKMVQVFPEYFFKKLAFYSYGISTILALIVFLYKYIYYVK